MQTKIYIPDIECESCTRLLSKSFKNMDGIEDFTVDNESIDVNHNSEVHVNDMIKKIQSLGFRASTKPFERKTLSERYRDFKENGHKYEIWSKIIRYSLLTLLVLILLQVIAYSTVLKDIAGFVPKYLQWMIYLDISIVTLGASIWYMYSYKSNVTCMTGMMIGMTVGMQTGMMIGAVVGATNGFFIGSMVGMILGVIAGAITGNCCGIMGIMQGMMAGLMGGTMGPMISLMMLSDHLNLFMPFYIIINVLILFGFMYMYFEEVVENKTPMKIRRDYITYLAICVIFTFALMAIMLWGPKSLLFQ